ncbi:MAG: hypothetical protein ABI743_04660 [bacterium]
MLHLLRRDFLWLLGLVFALHWVVQRVLMLPAFNDHWDRVGVFFLLQWVIAVVIWPVIAELPLRERFRALGGWPAELAEVRQLLLMLGLVYGEVCIALAGYLVYSIVIWQVVSADPAKGPTALAYLLLVGVVYGLWWSMARVAGPVWLRRTGALLVSVNLLGWLTLLYDPTLVMGIDRWWEQWLRTLCVPYALLATRSEFTIFLSRDMEVSLGYLILVRELILALVLVYGRQRLGRWESVE